MSLEIGLENNKVKKINRNGLFYIESKHVIAQRIAHIVFLTFKQSIWVSLKKEVQSKF